MNDNYEAIEEKLGKYLQVGTRIRRTSDINFHELERQGPCFVIGNGTCYIFKRGCFFEHELEVLSHNNAK